MGAAGQVLGRCEPGSPSHGLDGQTEAAALTLGQEAPPCPGPASSFCISNHILAFLGQTDVLGPSPGPTPILTGPTLPTWTQPTFTWGWCLRLRWSCMCSGCELAWPQ